MKSAQLPGRKLEFVAALAASAAALLMPINSMAQVSGLWRVSGDIDGKAFVVDCRFVPNGSQFGGECTDVATGEAKQKAGKKHEVKQGSVAGTEVRWSYPVKVMIMSVDIEFAGALSGNRMNGTVTAKGREGHFTAIRN